jgi:hypothetical protein
MVIFFKLVVMKVTPRIMAQNFKYYSKKKEHRKTHHIHHTTGPRLKVQKTHPSHDPSDLLKDTALILSCVRVAEINFDMHMLFPTLKIIL